jgi:hypothetical protein
MTTTTLASALAELRKPRILAAGPEGEAYKRAATGCFLPTSQRADGLYTNEATQRMTGLWTAAVEWTCSQLDPLVAPADTWTKERIEELARSLAEASAKNASVVPQLTFPHIYLGLCDALLDTPVHLARRAPAPADARALPKWIDDHKGADPFMDDVISYIESLLAQQATTSTPQVPAGLTDDEMIRLRRLMRAVNVDEKRWDDEQARDAMCTVFALAAGELERAAASQAAPAAAPAEQPAQASPAQPSAAPSIDTLEFRNLADDWAAASWRGWTRQEIQKKWTALIAHADAQFGRKAAAPTSDQQAGAVAHMPGDWTVEWDSYSPPGTIRLNSPKWGGCFLRPAESHDIGLHALAYRLLSDFLAAPAAIEQAGAQPVAQAEPIGYLSHAALARLKSGRTAALLPKALDGKDRLALYLAAPTPATDPEPDMLWLSDDNEVFANGPDDFAEDYACNCLRVGEEAEVNVDCANRARKRIMRIAMIPEGDGDDCKVVWKWVERTPAATPVTDQPKQEDQQ